MRLGTEFMPALEEGNLWIRASMPPTISLEAGIPAVKKIREILLYYPEVWVSNPVARKIHYYIHYPVGGYAS